MGPPSGIILPWSEGFISELTLRDFSSDFPLDDSFFLRSPTKAPDQGSIGTCSHEWWSPCVDSHGRNMRDAPMLHKLYGAVSCKSCSGAVWLAMTEATTSLTFSIQATWISSFLCISKELLCCTWYCSLELSFHMCFVDYIVWRPNRLSWIPPKELSCLCEPPNRKNSRIPHYKGGHLCDQSSKLMILEVNKICDYSTLNIKPSL